MSIPGVVDQLGAMEVGLGPWELMESDGEGGGVLVARLKVVVDEETGMRQESDIVDVEISTEEPAAAASKTRSNASKNTALAVAATAAVELTNLFFLLSGDIERRCGWIEGISMLFAFAAFLSAAGLVLVRNAVGKRTAICDACRRVRVLLVVSATALFVASAGTVLSLLNAQGWRDTL